jgi:two-component sensor histidine kinase
VDSVPPALALTLVEAMVTTSATPLLLLDGDLSVLALSSSACRAFRLDPVSDLGVSVFSMGNGEWDLPRFRSLLDAVATGGAEIAHYEMDLAAAGGSRSLLIDAHKLDYDQPGTVRVLLAVADLTDQKAAARNTEQLLADKILLNRELQHRIANSLQIIASVLMQSASRAGSDEARTHLHQAHSRVISIAEVQRQLAATGADVVALRPYLTQLCASIAALMVRDPERLSIKLTVDDTSVSSDVSVSLGLIVTELVINALKHAYPDDRSGTIKVDYAGDGEGGGWMLEVADDGVGMSPAGEEPATAGLGTSLVEALVRQRRAKLTLIAGHPGTTVSIRHEPSDSTGSNVVPLARPV